MMNLQIIGTGRQVPELAVENKHLEAFLDTSDEWIRQRTGIATRHVLQDETLTDIAAAAARAALSDALTSPAELDLILCATMQGDYITPSLACQVQNAIGAKCPAFDINAACSGFLYALDVAAAYLGAGRASRILVVCAEALSRMVDWQDRSTCVLFGDGAGAVVLQPGNDLLAIRTSAVGGTQALRAPVHPGNSPFARGEAQRPYIFMDGQEIYRFAVSAVDADVDQVLQQAGLSPDDITFFLLHQANSRIIEGARRRIHQPESKFPVNIDRYGNTSGASIPILLDEMNRSGALHRGDKLLMSAFGGGLTTGACILTWSK